MARLKSEQEVAELRGLESSSEAYEALQRKADALRHEKTQLQQEKRALEKQLVEKDFALEQLSEKELEIRTLQESVRSLHSDDYDTLEQLRLNHEAQLRHQREEVLRKRGEDRRRQDLDGYRDKQVE